LRRNPQHGHGGRPWCADAAERSVDRQQHPTRSEQPCRADGDPHRLSPVGQQVGDRGGDDPISWRDGVEPGRLHPDECFHQRLDLGRGKHIAGIDHRFGDHAWFDNRVGDGSGPGGNGNVRRGSYGG
jgi:hypothetical protein